MVDASKVQFPDNFPETCNIIVEIPAGNAGVKYEFDKDINSIVVDRFFTAPMHYPMSYGFIPNTLSDDGDPADVLVITPFNLIPGVVIKVRPVAVLIMEDESGIDEKIIAVPASDVAKGYNYERVQDIDDIEQILLDQVKHFFEHYKDLEKNKWVNVKGFEGKAKALEIIAKSKDQAEK